MHDVNIRTTWKCTVLHYNVIAFDANMIQKIYAQRSQPPDESEHDGHEAEAHASNFL